MSAETRGRRRFLRTGGIAAGVLVAGGGGALVATTPRVAFPEESFAGTSDGHGHGHEHGRVLVAYASKAGSTAEVASFIGRKLAGAGLAVDVRRARSVRSVDGYRAVVLGSAIRAGNWLSEASGLLKTHREALAARRTAFFTVCMTLYEDTPANREKVNGYLKPVREILEPDAIGSFAGKMELEKLALVPRLIAKAVKVPEGDFRNWEAIASWADALSKQLTSA